MTSCRRSGSRRSGPSRELSTDREHGANGCSAAVPPSIAGLDLSSVLHAFRTTVAEKVARVPRLGSYLPRAFQSEIRAAWHSSSGLHPALANRDASLTISGSCVRRTSSGESIVPGGGAEAAANGAAARRIGCVMCWSHLSGCAAGEVPAGTRRPATQVSSITSMRPLLDRHLRKRPSRVA